MKLYTTHIIATDHSGFTVEDYIKQILHCSGRQIQKLTRQKGILLNNKAVFLQRKIKAGDRIRILNAADTGYGVTPEQGKLEIIYEDDYLFVINKPAGQLIHPTGQTTSGTLANYLAYYLQQQKITNTIRPLHRLDRETSGCIVFSKDAQSQFLLEQQLKAKTLLRTYLALVKGTPQPPTGIITAPIGPHPRLPNRRTITADGETAITHYHTKTAFSTATLLELQLETGRTHQIRLHLSHIGYPIIGDGMYGIRSPFITRQALHAVSLQFHHLKTNCLVKVEAPLPADFVQALECAKSTN